MHRPNMKVRTQAASCPDATRRLAQRPAGMLRAGAALLALAMSASLFPPALAQSKAGDPKAAAPPAGAGELTMWQYLDRLMMAESGGRLDARNRRSTAVGPYQFIESTFIEVARRHFPAETAQLPLPQLLALRTDLAFSRRAAEAHTKDTAAILASQDIAPSWQHLRLAFIVGPGGATRLLKASPDAPLTGLLTPAALIANPFMAGMTVRALLAKASRDVSVAPSSVAGVDPGPAGQPGARARLRVAGIPVRCNLALPSCRKWVALHQHQVAPERVASRAGQRAAKR